MDNPLEKNSKKNPKKQPVETPRRATQQTPRGDTTRSGSAIYWRCWTRLRQRHGAEVAGAKEVTPFWWGTPRPSALGWI